MNSAIGSALAGQNTEGPVSSQELRDQNSLPRETVQAATLDIFMNLHLWTKLSPPLPPAVSSSSLSVSLSLCSRCLTSQDVFPSALQKSELNDVCMFFFCNKFAPLSVSSWEQPTDLCSANNGVELLSFWKLVSQLVLWAQSTTRNYIRAENKPQSI